MENLISNAMKFSGKDGVVDVSLHAGNGVSKLEVKDNGPGIPPEFQQRIFEKFGQVQARAEGKRFSSGLGLTFCKLAVESQNGSIQVESVSGEGSLFRVQLPTAESYAVG